MHHIICFLCLCSLAQYLPLHSNQTHWIFSHLLSPRFFCWTADLNHWIFRQVAGNITRTTLMSSSSVFSKDRMPRRWTTLGVYKLILVRRNITGSKLLRWKKQVTKNWAGIQKEMKTKQWRSRQGTPSVSKGRAEVVPGKQMKWWQQVIRH